MNPRSSHGPAVVAWVCLFVVALGIALAQHPA
jgi:hypothetical protein